MSIPAAVIEKAWQQWFNCDDEPLCDQQPFEQARFNAAAQLIWNAAVERAAQIAEMNGSGDYAIAKAIRAMSQEG